jgi:UDP-glucuronate decarboxylase
MEVTIRELADIVIALTGSFSRMVHLPLSADDPRQRCPDISKAQELLGWQPKMALRDGLMKTIDYFERLLSSQSTISTQSNS